MKRVLAIGVFDLFHIGHLRYLQYAKAQGHHLTVAVTIDAMALKVKGKLPAVPEQQRLEIVRGLACVDKTEFAPCSTEFTQEAAAWIKQWQVDHVVCGGGWQGSERWARLQPVLEASGISVSYAPETEDISSTHILRQIKQQPASC